MLKDIIEDAKTAVIVTFITGILGTVSGEYVYNNYVYKMLSPDKITQVSQIPKPIPAKPKRIKMYDKQIWTVLPAKRIHHPFRKMTWQKAIKTVTTPADAQEYLDCHLFQKSIYGTESFATTHKSGRGDCDEYAIAAAALLSDNGYTPNMLTMFGKESAHGVFLYKTQFGFGALGNTPIEANHKNIDSLIEAINIKYKGNYNSYVIIDLNKTYPNNEWINGKSTLRRKLCSDYKITQLKDHKKKLRYDKH